MIPRLKEFLFTKHILVNETGSNREACFPTLFALAGTMGIRITEGADLAVIDAAEAEAAEAALEFGDGCELLGIPVLLDRSEAEKEAAGSEEWEKVYSLFVNRTGNNTEDSMKNRPENSIENNSEKSTGDRKPEL